MSSLNAVWFHMVFVLSKIKYLNKNVYAHVYVCEYAYVQI